MDTASTPFIKRYSWIASTSDFFSANIKTGGGVFCKLINRWGMRDSGLTYSTSWMILVLAAPARPTFTVTGLTRALFAKFFYQIKQIKLG